MDTTLNHITRTLFLTILKYFLANLFIIIQVIKHLYFSQHLIIKFI